MTVPVIEGTTELYKIEGLLLVEELEDGLVVLARSSVLRPDVIELDEARAVAAKGRTLVKIQTIEHSQYEKTPFLGARTIVEVYA